MSEIIYYFLKVIGVQAVLYGLYIVAFHQSGRHALNRVYLLSSILIGFAIPLMPLPSFGEATTQIVELEQAKIWFTAAESTNTTLELIPVEKVKAAGTFIYLFAALFPLISIVLFLKFVAAYIQLIRFKRKAVLVDKSWYSLYRTAFMTPFSFFNQVFLPESLFHQDSYQQVLAHECCHVKQRHSFDRLFMELTLTICWFNPLLYLFKRRLIEVHEFQADESVISQLQDPIAYQEVLFNQLIRTDSVALVNHFNFSTIKKRIKMMNKKQKMSGWIYSFSLPVLLATVIIFSTKHESRKIAQLSADVGAVMGDLTEVDFGLAEGYTPSILPLKNSGKVAITAGFGTRMHPILKVEKFHQGLDFRTPVGNPVLATADGIVVAVDQAFGDWGKRVIIDHNGLYKTTYAHMSEIIVSVGDQVKRGQEIALSGSSGASTGPHLHYEVIETETGFVDPIEFIHDYDFKQAAK